MGTEGLWIGKTCFEVVLEDCERMVDGELQLQLPERDFETEVVIFRSGEGLSLILRLEMVVMASEIVRVEDESLEKIERCLSDASWMRLLLICCKLSL